MKVHFKHKTIEVPIETLQLCYFLGKPPKYKFVVSMPKVEQWKPKK